MLTTLEYDITPQIVACISYRKSTLSFPRSYSKSVCPSVDRHSPRYHVKM